MAKQPTSSEPPFQPLSDAASGETNFFGLIAFAWVFSVCFHSALLLIFSLLGIDVIPRGLPADRGPTLAVSFTKPTSTEYFVFRSSSEEEAASPSTAATPEIADNSSPFPAESAASASSSASSQLPENLQLPTPTSAGAEVARIGAPRTQPVATVKRLPQGDYSKWLAAESARIQSEMPRGEPVEVSLFGGPPSVGRSFVFVIDRSKSMGGAGLNALSAAGKELSAALQRLQPVHRFTVIAYHHELAFLDGRRLLEATPQNQSRVQSFLDGLAAFGQTEHELGLLGALRLKPDVIYLFTDGGDPHLNGPQLKEIRNVAGSQNTTIHCVQFGFGPLKDDNSFLVRLALESSGGFTYVDMSK